LKNEGEIHLTAKSETNHFFGEKTIEWYQIRMSRS
jgi:hypothetical protein